VAALSAVSSGRTGEAVTYEESVATSAIASLGLRLDCTVRGLGGGLGGLGTCPLEAAAGHSTV
jgi:hypothetical protein